MRSDPSFLEYSSHELKSKKRASKSSTLAKSEKPATINTLTLITSRSMPSITLLTTSASVQNTASSKQPAGITGNVSAEILSESPNKKNVLKKRLIHLNIPTPDLYHRHFIDYL